MKNTFCYVVLFLLGLTMMASCGEKPEHQATENVEQKQTMETVEEKQEDFRLPAFSIDGDNFDTVRYKDFVFISQPIPEMVKARMQGKSMPDNATIGFDELRYLTLYHYDYEGNIQKGEMVCHQAIAHDLLCIFRALFRPTTLPASITVQWSAAKGFRNTPWVWPLMSTLCRILALNMVACILRQRKITLIGRRTFPTRLTGTTIARKSSPPTVSHGVAVGLARRITSILRRGEINTQKGTPKRTPLLLLQRQHVLCNYLIYLFFLLFL